MEALQIAERVRAACARAAAAAHEDAGVQGLCAEGRWEAAVSAIERLDLQALLRALDAECAETRSETR